jgi:hypothetical protein
MAAPVAPDTSFLGDATESYPMVRMLETYAVTDHPRRLRPIALHYHAFASSSPGGVRALDALYAWLARERLFVVRVDDYRARVRAFRRQVTARDLSGAYEWFGGEALRTVRVPLILGALDQRRSSGIATIADLPQGRYVTFAASGARRLSFASRPVEEPHLTLTNGRVESFQRVAMGDPGLHIEFAVLAEEPVALSFAGLPPTAACAFRWGGGERRSRVDENGRLSFMLRDVATGLAALVCAAEVALP